MHTGPSLYVMLSHTTTGVGKFIRRMSGYDYSHVSLSLDSSHRRWVSFARYAHNCALYGGFVVEPIERFLADGGPVPVRIFRLPLTDEQYRHLQTRFANAGDPENGFLYNLFDVPAAYFHRHFPLPNAYTCLSFACDVLDISVCNIAELDKHLEPHLIYDGDLAALTPDTGDRGDRYFQPLKFPEKWRLSAHHFARLSARLWRQKVLRQ